MFKDLEIFVYIYKYYNKFNRLIYKSESELSDSVIDKFIINESPNIFVRGNLLIFDVNDAFCTEFGIDEQEMYDLDCTKIF